MNLLQYALKRRTALTLIALAAMVFATVGFIEANPAEYPKPYLPLLIWLAFGVALPVWAGLYIYTRYKKFKQKVN